MHIRLSDISETFAGTHSGGLLDSIQFLHFYLQVFKEAEATVI